jgi:hypothetical protein
MTRSFCSENSLSKETNGSQSQLAIQRPKPQKRTSVKVVSRFRRSTSRLLHAIGIVAALTACALGFSPSVWAQSACDLNGDGSVTSADVTVAINMALGTTPCTANIEGPNTCTVITVQRVVNASLGQPCTVYNGHAAILSWTASTTPDATYNVYRATSSSGPFTTPVNTAPITGTTFTDTTVQAGQTYYYVATAVSGGIESAASSPPVQATIPSP